MNKIIIKRGVIIVCVAFLLLFAVLGFMKFSNDYGSPIYQDEVKKNNFIVSQIMLDENDQIVFTRKIDINLNEYIAHENEFKIFKDNLIALLEKQQTELLKNLSEKFDEDKIEKDIEIVLPIWENYNQISYQIKFASIDVFAVSCKDVKFDYNKNLFMSLMNFKFSPDIFEAKRSENFINEIKSCASETSFENEISQSYKPSFYFDFTSLVRRAGSNADYFIKNAEGFHHVWKLDNNQKESLKVSLKFIQAAWWYLLGISVPLGIMIVGIIVFAISSKVKKNRDKKFDKTNFIN